MVNLDDQIRNGWDDGNRVCISVGYTVDVLIFARF